MRKEFGAFLFLGLLVLSLSFSSAGWFSDAWNTITGHGITGNAINGYGFNDSELYCGNHSTCSNYNGDRCGNKASHLSAAGINVSKVKSVDLLSIKCYTGMGPAKIVACPVGTSYDVCVQNTNDGAGSYILLGVKYGVASTPVTCTSFTYSEWSVCNSTGIQTRTVLTSSPSGCTGGVSPVLMQTCTSSVTCTDSSWTPDTNTVCSKALRLN